MKVVEYAGVEPLFPIDDTAAMFGDEADASPNAALTASGAAVLFAHSSDSRMGNRSGVAAHVQIALKISLIGS
jgi:hypothetical protein